MATGHIKKRGQKYYIVYPLGEKRKWECAGPRKRDAEKLLSRRLAEIANGTLRELKNIPFEEFADMWLREYAETSVKDSTLVSYRSIVENHLKPFFGDTKLRRITSLDCQRLVTAKIKGGRVKPKTVCNILVPLQEMFKHAVRWGYLSENPARHVERPRVERKTVSFLKTHEIRPFLESVNHRYRLLFFTAVFTGLRRGELLALRWGDIDPMRGVIRVTRSLYSGRFVEPKSRTSVRTVQVSPLLLRALVDRRIQSDAGDDDLVFCTQQGKPLDPDNLVKRQFIPALKRAGLPAIRFHDLRHTYVALLIAQGQHPKFIQSQLGHASIQVTFDRYGHLMPEVGSDAGERLDEAVFGKSVSKPLANGLFPDSCHKGEAPEPIEVQGLNLVAGAGFEPATFGL